jgi:pimeloyl-ACP methyl ester carboxylesterase
MMVPTRLVTKRPADRRWRSIGWLALALGVVVGVSGTSADEPAHKFFTTSDGIKLHYMELGRGTPVILIHGYTANAEGKWFKSGIAQALAGKYRVVAIDARGHGQSDKPHDPAKYGPRMATDVVELMDHLKIRTAHIHGYSMGGSILAQLVARHEDRIVTAIFGGSGVQEVDPKRQAEVPKEPEPPPAGAPGAPRGENWSAYPGYDRAALDAVQKYSWTPEDRAIDLAKVKIPVLAIVGSLDRPEQRTRRMQRELKNFQRVIVDGETHGSVHLNPIYTKTLVAFIDKHDAKPR